MVIAPQLGSAFSSTEVNSAPLLDYMRLVFVPQLVRPAMGKRYAEDFTRGSLQLASNFPFFTDALLACSAAEVKENDIFHLQLAESYYLKAVGGMRTYLATTSASLLTEIIALRTVMILCVFEVSTHPAQRLS